MNTTAPQQKIQKLILSIIEDSKQEGSQEYSSTFHTISQMDQFHADVYMAGYNRAINNPDDWDERKSYDQGFQAGIEAAPEMAARQRQEASPEEYARIPFAYADIGVESNQNGEAPEELYYKDSETGLMVAFMPLAVYPTIQQTARHLAAVAYLKGKEEGEAKVKAEILSISGVDEAIERLVRRIDHRLEPIEGYLNRD